MDYVIKFPSRRALEKCLQVSAANKSDFQISVTDPVKHGEGVGVSSPPLPLRHIVCSTLRAVALPEATRVAHLVEVGVRSGADCSVY